MYFCDSCENMMHLRIPNQSENESSSSSASTNNSVSSSKHKFLYYMCPHCGLTKTIDKNQSSTENEVDLENTNDNPNLVYTVNYDEIKEEVDVINEYTKYDPTLPITDVIPCPNQVCVSNHSEDKKRAKREIIYIRYNKTELLYIYMCKHCNATWKSTSNSV